MLRNPRPRSSPRCRLLPRTSDSSLELERRRSAAEGVGPQSLYCPASVQQTPAFPTFSPTSRSLSPTFQSAYAHSRFPQPREQASRPRVVGAPPGARQRPRSQARHHRSTRSNESSRAV
jgi:hypothetical protein